MKNIKKSYLLLLTVAAFFVCGPSSAALKSRTVEFNVVENDILVGKKVILTCSPKDEKREIFRKKGSLRWCDTALPDMCFKSKNRLSDAVCSKSYRNKIASQQGQAVQNEKNEQVGELESELMEIEQKRLDIADKVLELKRRELELQKSLN